MPDPGAAVFTFQLTPVPSPLLEGKAGNSWDVSQPVFRDRSLAKFHLQSQKSAAANIGTKEEHVKPDAERQQIPCGRPRGLPLQARAVVGTHKEYERIDAETV